MWPTANGGRGRKGLHYKITIKEPSSRRILGLFLSKLSAHVHLSIEK